MLEFVLLLAGKKHSIQQNLTTLNPLHCSTMVLIRILLLFFQPRRVIRTFHVRGFRLVTKFRLCWGFDSQVDGLESEKVRKFNEHRFLIISNFPFPFGKQVI